MLRIQNLCTGIAKKKIQLHHNIQLHANEPQLILLIGPNGIGKSVFLKTLCGLIAPISGTVHVKDNNIHEITAEKRASLTSILLATTPSIDQMSVQEMVISGRQRFLSGWKNPSAYDLQMVQESMTKAGIFELKDASFGALSDGIKQKVMLARCLAQDSQLILLDEPLAFLDYPSRINFLKLLQRLVANEGKTIVYSSHDMQLSLNHCDSVIALTQNQWQHYTRPGQVPIKDIFSHE